MNELLPLIAGRPVVLKKDGWTVFVSVRDQAYLREKRSWKRLLKASHPDSGGSAPKFRGLLKKYRSWMWEERKHYWRLDLMPPDWKGKSMVPPPGLVRSNSGAYIAQTRYAPKELEG